MEEQNSRKNFFIYKKTKIPWARVAAIQVFQKKKQDGNNIVLGVIKLMNENGSVTKGDENLKIETTESEFERLNQDWEDWVARMQDASNNGGKSFFQSEEKVFDEKMDAIKEALSRSLTNKTQEVFKKVQEEAEKTENYNALFEEKINDLDDKINKVNGLFETLSSFLTDLSTLQEAQKETEDQLAINQNLQEKE